MIPSNWRDHWRPGKLVDLGDVRLWCDEEGDGEPLLLLSGFGIGHHLFDFIWPELADYRRITLEPRGLGRSDRPKPPYGLDVWADDTVRLLDALGIERAHIWATAFGTYYAIRLAVEHPERVGCLVTGNEVWAGDPTKRYAAIWKLDSAIMELYGTSEHGMKLYKNFIPMPEDDVFVEWVCAGIQDVRHADRHDATVGYMHLEADVRADLSRLTVPTMVFQGTEKIFEGVLAGEDDEDPSLDLMKAAIPGLEIARVVSGHPFFVIAEKPRECADVVRAFLRRNPLGAVR